MEKPDPNYDGIASVLIRNEHGQRVFLHWQGAWLAWTTSGFIRIKDRQLEQHVYQFEELRSWNRWEREELSYHLKQQAFLDDEATLPCFIAEPRRRRDDVIVASNGRFRIDDLLVGRFNPEPNSPDFITEVALPYAIEQGATCERWLQFVEEVFEGDQQRIDLLQEWAGYLLVPDVQHEKFMVLAGRGANGKTRAAQVLRELVGEKNTASVSIETLSRQFGQMGLMGRRFVLVNEPDESSRAAEGDIKGLVTGEPRTIDRKYKEPVDWTPQIKLMIVCNRLPQFRDKTDGLRRRCIIVPFQRQFFGEQCDLDLGGKLRAELPGIFLWALQGLARLRANNGFTEPVACVDAQDEHFRLSDPLGEFIRANIVAKEGGQIKCRELVKLLNNWCKEMGFRSEFSAPALGKELREVFRPEVKVEYKKLTDRDEYDRREHAWTNIAWSHESLATILSKFDNQVVKQDEKKAEVARREADSRGCDEFLQQVLAEHGLAGVGVGDKSQQDQ